MSRSRGGAIDDLLAAKAPPPARETIEDGAMLLRGFAAAEEAALWAAVEDVVRQAPFRNMVTPGGFRMSVAMTNCGAAGWITDRRGYRYERIDPETGRPWPAMPPLFHGLAARAALAAGFADFVADACLVNRYEPSARMTLHQDKNERDFSQPIVSISLGLPAIFLFGGEKRSNRPRRFRLASGDVLVWGGPARLRFHGIEKLLADEAAGASACRINLTLRKAL